MRIRWNNSPLRVVFGLLTLAIISWVSLSWFCRTDKPQRAPDLTIVPIQTIPITSLRPFSIRSIDGFMIIEAHETLSIWDESTWTLRKQLSIPNYILENISSCVSQSKMLSVLIHNQKLKLFTAKRIDLTERTEMISIDIPREIGSVYDCIFLNDQELILVTPTGVYLCAQMDGIFTFDSVSSSPASGTIYLAKDASSISILLEMPSILKLSLPKRELETIPLFDKSTHQEDSIDKISGIASFVDRNGKLYLVDTVDCRVLGSLSPSREHLDTFFLRDHSSILLYSLPWGRRYPTLEVFDSNSFESIGQYDIVGGTNYRCCSPTSDNRFLVLTGIGCLHIFSVEEIANHIRSQKPGEYFVLDCQDPFAK